MKRYTQAEILEEGFWDLHKSPILKGIGKVARGAAGAVGAAVKGGAYLANALAPELTAPLNKLEAGVRGFGSALKQGYIKASTPEATYIENKLTNQGYSIIGDVNKMKMRPGDEKQLYYIQAKIRPEFIGISEPNPTKLFLVDKEGGIVRDLSAKNAANAGPPKKQKKQKVLSGQTAKAPTNAAPTPAAPAQGKNP